MYTTFYKENLCGCEMFSEMHLLCSNMEKNCFKSLHFVEDLVELVMTAHSEIYKSRYEMKFACLFRKKIIRFAC